MASGTKELNFHFYLISTHYVEIVASGYPIGQLSFCGLGISKSTYKMWSLSSNPLKMPSEAVKFGGITNHPRIVAQTDNHLFSL